MATTLLILDFSGTLSLEAVRFGTSARLAMALQQSGLQALGVDTERYWNDLVVPTWVEGSTTRIGLRTLLSRKLQERGIPLATAVRSAGRFTRAYMAASVIDPAWQPLFAILQSRPQIIPLIATDHYAEATFQIAGELATLGWSARALRREHNRIKRVRVGPLQHTALAFIANSADLGVAKADPRFWQYVQIGLPERVTQVIVVDDFGANENLADFYADPTRVERRRQQTISAIEEVFHVSVQMIWFTLDRRIEEIIQKITGSG